MFGVGERVGAASEVHLEQPLRWHPMIVEPAGELDAETS